MTVTLDFDRSTITIAGKTYPACAIEVTTCDDYETDSRGCARCRDNSACLFGGSFTDQSWDRWEVYVPSENGVLFAVEHGQVAPAYGGGEGYSLHLHSAVMRRGQLNSDDAKCWLLGYYTVLPDKTLRERDHDFINPWYWSGCEPEWIAEQIDRLSTWPVHPIEGPRCKLVPIGDSRIRKFS